MIRRAAIYTLAASLALATTPAFACTGISLKSQDGAAIRGRTLEFGFPLQSNVIVVPAGKEFTAVMPDGGKGLTYTTRYGIVGANAFDQVAIIDGLNDQGLSVGLFYFPGYAQYADASQVDAAHALAPQDFGMWVLGNFATVDEVKKAVEDIAMVATPMPGLGSAKGAPADVHFFIQDRSGKSIAVEPIDGKLKVTDAPLGVMTNAPTYDWHLTNLNNYLNLSVKDVTSSKLGPVGLSSFGTGAGLHGLPGDFTPPSRFVRAAIFSQAATPNAEAEDAVFSAFHILNQFDIPKGSVQGSVVSSTAAEITEWTSVNDLKNLRWYFRTYQDQSIRMVDLEEAIKAAKGEIRTIDMETSAQKVQNVSTEVKSPNHAAAD
ncbi:MAG: linear amide C-N hydrolase [Methyloceanibacter sp.]|uniref:linear amide C-N hydrolase n=1 Tax=Methyloceanibacter sp. TaxID=1965321 RepID=UPI003D6C9163